MEEVPQLVRLKILDGHEGPAREHLVGRPAGEDPDGAEARRLGRGEAAERVLERDALLRRQPDALQAYGCIEFGQAFVCLEEAN